MGPADAPIVIRAAEGQSPLLTRPADQIDRYNNIEFVDCSYLVIRGLRFKGGNSGVRFIRGHHITFEDCEVFETGNNALTMNSGSCDSFVIRRNHLHHTGLSTTRPTEGEGMYIGCHDGSCITTNTLVEGNYIHHLRSTSDGGNDGIEIKVGSYGNIVRDNVIHDTNIGRRYPGIFVYGGGPQVNIVEGNAIWNAGEGIQVVSDAIVRNNIIFDCSATGITAAPHAAVRRDAKRHDRQQHDRQSSQGSAAPLVTGRRHALQQQRRLLSRRYGHRCLGDDGCGRSAPIMSRAGWQGWPIDGMRFLEGGTISQAFTIPEQNQFWPKPGSPLIGHADSSVAPELDFNHAARRAPQDVGAYESDGQISNPGWNVQAGFKRVQ